MTERRKREKDSIDAAAALKHLQEGVYSSDCEVDNDCISDEDEDDESVVGEPDWTVAKALA